MFANRFINFGRRFCSNETKGTLTALYDFHVEKGGKIVNFGGFLLPVQYNDQSISDSHTYTRKRVSLFDVSHMLQTEITGKDCVKYFESLCTANVEGLKPGAATLTVFTNNKGGIIDDLIVTKLSDDHLYVVSNAGRKKEDQKVMLDGLQQYKTKNKAASIKLHFFEPADRSLLALQGPYASHTLQELTQVDLTKLYFMNSISATIAEVQGCRITRCGYTGEDGFEISIPAMKSVDVAQQILKGNVAKLAGLGARDSLRLEAGLCLYGNDITEETTPVEAGLTWLVAKRRRELKDFPGAEVIVRQIQEGVERKRIGLVSDSGPPPRRGAQIFDENGSKEVGVVTSGCPGPSIKKNVAMGYVKSDFSKADTNLKLKIRDKFYDAVVSKMPFVKANYYNKPK